MIIGLPGDNNMMRRPRAGVFSTALLLAFLGTTTLALENGLARTPVMGWSTWNAFLCKEGVLWLLSRGYLSCIQPHIEKREDTAVQ